MFTLGVAPCVASSVVVRLLAVTVPGLRRVRHSNRSNEGGVIRVAHCLAVTLNLLRSIVVMVNFCERGCLARGAPLAIVVIIASLATNSTMLV